MSNVQCRGFLLPKFKLTQQGPVATIALDNPPLNTLDVPLMTELAQTVRKLASAPVSERPRAILLTSAVPHQFSAGIDPQAILGTDMAGRKQVFLALGDLCEALWFALVPVVADVTGPALAGGAVLATLADFAVIDGNAGKICFSEVKVGLPLPYFVQRLVQRKINPSVLNDVLLLGRNVDAQEAVRIGFANAVYTSSGERDEALQSILGRITRLPPAAITETLRQNRGPDRGLLRAFREDLVAFADFLTDDFLGKGLRAVVKGESPKF